MKLKTLLIAVMSLVAMATTAQEKTAYAVYCEKFETGTLYFLNSSETLTDGGTFTLGGEELTITKLWSGEQVTNSDLSTEWNTYFQTDNKSMFLYSVVIDESFKEVKPKSLASWFESLSKLSSIEGLENLDTSEATDMRSMFSNCHALTELDLSSFDTGKVENMMNMFLNCTSLKKLDVSSFNTSNVTIMTSMFNGCKALTELDLSSFDTGKVTHMTSMFVNCSALTYIDKRDDFGANATVTTNMYLNCDPLLQGSTPYVVYNDADKSLHFLCNANADLTAITLGDGTEITLTEGNYWKADDVLVNDEAGYGPGWRTLKSNVSTVVFDESFKFARPINCYRWFNGFTNLTTITGLDYLYTSKVTGMKEMFSSCEGLTSLAFGENFNTANVTNMHGMFWACKGLATLDISNFNTSNVADMSYMFSSCTDLNPIAFGDNFNTSNVTNMESMFASCRNLQNLDLGGFNTSKVNNMNNMFGNCEKLASISFGNDFNTSNVEIMGSMFSDCRALSTLDLSGFNTSKVKNMSNMFYRCTGFQSLDLSSFDLESVIDMSYMFYVCSNLESIKTGEKFTTQSPITTLALMFRSCSKLTALDLSGIKTDGDTKLNDMFYGCTALQSLDIRNFKPKQSTNAASMFRNCTALTDLDIRNFYVSMNISNDLVFCDKLMKLNMSAATGDVTLLADNEAFNGRGMMISVPDGFDLANVSTENYIVKTTGTSFARAFTSGNMSTICLPYAVDATAIAEQGTLYKYVDIVDNAVKFTAVTGETTPGEAYLFKPATGDKVIFTGTDVMTDLPAEITEGTGAGLYGTYTGKKFTADEAASGIYFGWANGSFWRAGENAEVKHNRAYLKTAAGTTPARLSVKLDDETTGISDVNTTADDDNASAFDLMGRRVGTGYKGIVIKNGKKVFK